MSPAQRTTTIKMTSCPSFCAPSTLPSKLRRPHQRQSAGRPRTVACSLARVPRRTILEAAALSLGASALPQQTAAVPTRPRWTNDVLFDEASGSFIPPSSMGTLFARDLGRKYDRVIVASEIHDHPKTHAAQLEVLERARLLNDGRPLVVGFEQFYRVHDGMLAQYIAGEISLPTLLKRTKWEDTWGYDPALYAPIFQYCRVHRLRMVGLNVPRPLVTYVSRFGLAGMAPELRAYLPDDLDTGSRPHFQLFQELIGVAGHAADPRTDMATKLWRWYEAQVVWDEYMGESVAQVLTEAPNSRIVALIGSGHVQRRVGFPDRIEKRLDERPYTIVPRVVSWSSDEGHSMPDIAHPEKGVADILWYTNRTIDLA